MLSTQNVFCVVNSPNPFRRRMPHVQNRYCGTPCLYSGIGIYAKAIQGSASIRYEAEPNNTMTQAYRVYDDDNIVTPGRHA